MMYFLINSIDIIVYSERIEILKYESINWKWKVILIVLIVILFIVVCIFSFIIFSKYILIDI